MIYLNCPVCGDTAAKFENIAHVDKELVACQSCGHPGGVQIDPALEDDEAALSWGASHENCGECVNCLFDRVDELEQAVDYWRDTANYYGSAVLRIRTGSAADVEEAVNETIDGTKAVGVSLSFVQHALAVRWLRGEFRGLRGVVNRILWLFNLVVAIVSKGGTFR